MDDNHSQTKKPRIDAVRRLKAQQGITVTDQLESHEQISSGLEVSAM